MRALPALSDIRASTTAAIPQDAAISGSRFADAMHGAQAHASNPPVAATHQPAPATHQQAPATHLPAPPNRAARGPRTPAAAPARRGTAPAAASADAGQETNPLNAAPPAPAPSVGASAQFQADESAVPPAAFATAGQATAAVLSDTADPTPATPEAAAKTQHTSTSANDPLGLLAMIFGVTPTVFDATAGAGSGSGAVAGGGGGAGAAASAAAASPAAAQSAVPAVDAHSASAVSVATGADIGTLKLDGSGPAADQSTPAPSAQGLSDLVRGLNAAVGSASNVEQTIAPPVGSPSWPAAVAAQVHWLAGSGATSATLHLAPEHLGPVQVSIDLKSSEVNITFSAAHADTRAALELALPKLRDMFATGGLALGQATVQQEARSGSQSPAPPRVARTAETTGTAAPPLTLQALGLVDEYA
jgi:flagellar hook-length control protein FliK